MIFQAIMLVFLQGSLGKADGRVFWKSATPNDVPLLPKVCTGKDWERLGDISFQAGDTIKSSLLAPICTFLPPFHTAFALDDDRLADYGQNFNDNMKLVFMIKRRSDMSRSLHYSRVAVVRPDRKWKNVFQKGIQLAERMEGQTFYYHQKRCNCRHYTDYLTYGKTHGSWSAPWYWPMNDDCPLHNKFDGNTDVLSPDFTLHDKRGNVVHLPIVSNQDKRKRSTSEIKPSPPRKARTLSIGY